MKITRTTTLETGAGPADWFTGQVFIDPVAAPTRFMVHVAMQQHDETGSPVTWGDHVSDEQYAAAPPIDG